MGNKYDILEIINKIVTKFNKFIVYLFIYSWINFHKLFDLRRFFNIFNNLIDIL